MATAKKPTEPLDPGGELPAAASVAVGDKGPELVQATPVELESDTGGVFINTGFVDLVLLQPATVLKAGRTVELEYDPGHRDLRRATPQEIQAALDAAAAEQAAADAASSTPSTGQEQ